MIVEVVGRPAPQGSKRGFVVGKRAVIVADNPETLRSWRQAVTEAVAAASRGEGTIMRPAPVAVLIVFRLPRPKSQTKAQRAVAYVTTKPDLDKLARGVLDALTEARAFEDDSQVAYLSACKLYVDDGEALGARITVSPA